MNIIHTIGNYAETQPEKVAFRFRNGEITYGELWSQSGRLAQYLIDADLPPKMPIPVYGHKNTKMPVCFLACVRAGHAYVPMDTNMPEQRVHDILDSVGSPLMLATETPAFPIGETPGTSSKDVLELRGLSKRGNREMTMRDLLQVPDESSKAANSVRMITPEEILKTTEPFEAEMKEGFLLAADAIEYAKASMTTPDPAFENKKDDTHYIIFTSGSTGKPKGVQVSTGNLEAYLDWSTTLVDKKPGIFLNQAPFSFDLSVMDVYTGLATGSTIVSIDHALTEDLTALMAFLKKEQPTYWVSTPSFADLCLSVPDYTGESLPALRKFLFCGETLKKRTAGRLLERFPKADVINTYGPTETTVCVTEVKITPEQVAADGDLPIGFAKPGTGIYTIDEDGKKLPQGEVGELVITGDTVSQGYFQNPEKTAASFFTDADGEPAYRTGDSGYVREDGMIFCHGRMDGQIKLHGYRIELGDIEKNLLALDGVEDAAVFLTQKEGAGEALAACILQKPDEDTSYARRKYIRTTLKERIPAYMVPKRVVFFTEFPMTMNGKLDRKTLGGMI